MIRASYLQIYNENIMDLLKNRQSGLQIREDKRKGLFVEGLSEWVVRSSSEIYSLMKKGESFRATASTKLNDISSRSHAVFIIVIEQMSNIGFDAREDAPRNIKIGKLNLVDLAGSERLTVTGAVGKRLEECKKINQSLSALGNVIAALTDSKGRIHIPYRNSKLTRLLEDSLGGNCKTTMMTMISPACCSVLESLSSLKFAHRAKNIKNVARVNEDVDQRALLRRYETELRQLRLELEKTNKNVLNKESMYILEQEKRKAEEDKAAAIVALETLSREVKEEKDERKRLEDKIKMMSSQVLLAGEKIENTPQFLCALEEKHKIIKEEYDKKLHDLEKEREQIEEDKAEVDRYKQLLLKQRDIMIALTTRLNERDETIIKLQEELDAYDKSQSENERELEIKTMRIKVLENVLKTNKIPIPSLDDDISNLSIESIQHRYPPYGHFGEDIEDSTYFLNAEEKVNELSKIIEEQKNFIDNIERSFAQQVELQIEDRVKSIKVQMMKSIEAAVLSAKSPEKNTKLTQIIDKDMTMILTNSIKYLKEMRDSYRFSNVIQGLIALQKMLTTISKEFK